MVNVELLDASEITDDWYIGFLVPVGEAFRQSFDDFLTNFIRTVLNTDSVLFTTGAVELITI